MNIREKVRLAGVVGAGGAGFPTHAKLSGRAELVIANGAECEPLLRCDRLLMEREAERIVRGLELAMEAERFFDLVRWGDAKAVLDKFYAGETNTTIYQNSSFVENKLEYMPIPFNEMQNAKGLYKQNPGY